jgi:hypothetical protein
MPTTFISVMGDPPADILHSVPDALATTARYLRALGWRPGVPWGVEVSVPPALASGALSRDEHGCLRDDRPAGRCRTVARWNQLGIERVDGAPLAGDTRLDPTTIGALLMPAGPAGPAWIVTPNYEAIWRYNRADAYALAIGLLSDALRGAPPAPRTPWPTDDPGLSRAEFLELQVLLRIQGHEEVSPDGAEGPVSHTAIRVEETRLGWAPTGRAGSRLLAALRAAAAASESAAAPAPEAPSATAEEAPSAAEAPSAPR